MTTPRVSHSVDIIFCIVNDFHRKYNLVDVNSEVPLRGYNLLGTLMAHILEIGSDSKQCVRPCLVIYSAWA